MKILSKKQRFFESPVLTLILIFNFNSHAEDSVDDLLDDFSLEDLMDIIEAPYFFNNLAKGKAWGFDLASNGQATEWWDLAYSYLRKTKDTLGGDNLSTDNQEPQHRVSLRSNMGLSESLVLWLKYTSAHKSPNNPLLGTIAPENYLTLALRPGWTPVNNITLALVGQNLLESRHLEHQSRNFVLRSEIERSVYDQVAGNFKSVRTL